jgi:hypothetical protein
MPKKIICYTGKDSKPSGIHSNTEFLKAMNTFKNRCEPNCPKDVKGWINWSSALKNTPKECTAIVKKNKIIDSAYKKLNKATNKFDKCLDDKLCTYDTMDKKTAAKCGVLECMKESKKLINANKKINKLTAEPKKKI